METLENRIRDFTDELLRRMKLDLKAEMALEGETLKVALHGPDQEVALANHGKLLQALNYLLMQIFYGDFSDGRTLLVDCGDYRTARFLELKLMAQTAADRVRTSKSPFRMQPMPPDERRIVHLALVDDATVRTASEGFGENRYVVISPA